MGCGDEYDHRANGGEMHDCRSYVFFCVSREKSVR